MNRKKLINELGLRGVNGEFKGASLSQIAETEKNLNLALPDDYRRFLQEFGVALFAEEVAIKPIEPSPWSVDGKECFDIFYGVSADPAFDLCRINTRLKGDIPIGTIAIGHDSGSNLVLLSLVDNQIRFFDKETGKTFLIATSFTDFLNSFQRVVE
jgi:hypothetical protein